MVSPEFSQPIGVYCEECAKPFLAFGNKYDECTKKSDLRSLTWVACCHLVCAERVNLELEIKHPFKPTKSMGPSWTESKAACLEAIGKARQTLSSGDTLGRSFVDAMEQRAKQISQARAKKQTVGTQDGTLLPGGFSTFTMAFHAVHSKLVSYQDLEALIKSIPGSSWLTGGS